MAKEKVTEKEPKTLFEKAINYQIPKEKIEVIIDRNGGKSLSYVSWAYAWGMFKQLYPDAKYKIIKNDNGLPYFEDPQAGIMCYTEMTANGETHEMWLLVMDSSNKAMRFTPYEYMAWDKKSQSWYKKGVAAATMFDINKTLMRCLVKNMAMFGFGLNIYNGDDIPEFDLEQDAQDNAPKSKPTPAKTQQPKTPAQVQAQQPKTPAPVQTQQIFGSTLEILPNDPYAGVKQILTNLNTIDALLQLYKEKKNEVESNPDIKMLFGIRKGQINKTA